MRRLRQMQAIVTSLELFRAIFLFFCLKTFKAAFLRAWAVRKSVLLSLQGSMRKIALRQACALAFAKLYLSTVSVFLKEGKPNSRNFRHKTQIRPRNDGSCTAPVSITSQQTCTASSALFKRLGTTEV